MTKSRYLDIVIFMKVVNLFKALSDETRLRLVHLFLHFELNVNEIVAILGMGQSRISRHLKILTDTRLLTFRRDGLWTFYSTVTKGEGYTFIEAIKYIFQKDPRFGEDLMEAGRVLEKRSEETIRFFDSIAGNWGKLKREILGDVDLNSLILEKTPVSETIVDMGCGNGDLVAELKTKANHVIGVDKSPRMLEEARKRFKDDGENVNLRIGELEHLPLREGEADTAVVNMALHHLPYPVKAFREAHRVLKKGDSFIIVDLLAHQREHMRERYGDRWLGFSRDEIEKWLESSGFTLENFDYFDLKKGLKGFIAQSVKNKI